MCGSRRTLEVKIDFKHRFIKILLIFVFTSIHYRRITNQMPQNEKCSTQVVSSSPPFGLHTAFSILAALQKIMRPLSAPPSAESFSDKGAPCKLDFQFRYDLGAPAPDGHAQRVFTFGCKKFSPEPTLRGWKSAEETICRPVFRVEPAV